MAADTSARAMAGIFADLRRLSYFLELAATAPTSCVAANDSQRLSPRLAPATYTLAAQPWPTRPTPGAAPAAALTRPA